MLIPDDDQSELLDSVARDHKQFGHLTESLRDSALAGATRVVYGISGLNPKKPHLNSNGKETGEEPAIAKRYIADNGSGMTEATLKGTYSQFGSTKTVLNYDVVFDAPTNSIDVSVIPFDQTQSDPLHSRKGIGGRLTLLSWNRIGVVTIAVHEGVPNMVMQFRLPDRSGNEARYYPGKQYVVRPYKEQEYLSFTEVVADMTFMRNLLADDDEALAELDTLEPHEELPNPLFGYDWSAVVPDWIADKRPAKGLWTLNGEPAHGTVKFLMGESLEHSTALTGNPKFPNEAKSEKYQGYLQRNTLDLSGIEVRVQTLNKQDPTKAGHARYRVVGSDASYRWEGSTVGTLVVGQVPLRRGRVNPADDPTSTDKWWLIYDKVWNLSDYGAPGINAWISVADGETSGWSRTTGDFFVAVHYGNEIHHENDTGPTEYMFKNMGVPVLGGVHQKVAVLFDAPLASYRNSLLPGLYQNTSRDGLKWHGGDGDAIPWEDWHRAMSRHPEMAIIKGLLRKDSPDSEEAPPFDPVLEKKAAEAVGSVRPGETQPSPKSGKRGGGSDTLAVLEDPAGTVAANETGVQGKPGDTPREPCPLCGLLIHADDCPNKRPSHGGGGGTKGKRRRGIADPNGTFMGEQSDRAVTEGHVPQDRPEVKVPVVFFETMDRWVGTLTGQEAIERRKEVADWEMPDDLTKTGGRITICQDHMILASMREYQRGQLRKRSKDTADLMQGLKTFYRNKVQMAFVMQFAFTNISPYKGDPVLWSVDDTKKRLLKSDFWHGVFSTSYQTDMEMLAEYLLRYAAAA